jgi:hypothetical protein
VTRMTRFLLAGALVAGALFTTVPASACTLDQCPWAKPVCDLIDCTRPIPICDTDRCF